MESGATRKCILIIDEYPWFRVASSLLLSRMLPTFLVLEMHPSEENLSVTGGIIDLILLGLRAPYIKGLNFLAKVRLRFPTTPVILFSDDASDQAIQIGRAHGACGFLHSSANVDDLLAAIRDVLAGKPVFPGKHTKTGKNVQFQLSPRQMEVFELLCKGYTNKEIGGVLHMSDNTVRTHISAIFNLLDVHNRTEAAALGKYLIGL